MSSVASEISIFPPARPLPGPRGPSEPAGFDAGPGSFGNLLDNAPAQDAEPRAKRTDAKRASDKPGQPDNAGPIESNQQDAASPDVKPVKDTAPADAETAQAAPAGDAHAAPPAEPATPMPA